MTDPRGSALADPAFSIDYRYDDIGRLVAGILPLQDGVRPSVLLSYDPRGNLLKRTESDGGTIDYAYDDRNRLLTETVTAAYGDGSRATFTTTRTYDPAGNESTVTDGAGGQTVKQYDPLGRLIEVRDPEFAVETYAYDGYGNRTAITDGRGNTTRKTYDPYGRLTATVDPEGGIVRNAYDRLGRITRTVDALGHAIDFSYDELGRLVEERRADGAVRSYTYDGVGNMLSSLDPRGTAATYAYDDDYRLTAAARTNAGITEFSAYTYDAAGDRVTATENGVAAAYNTVDGVYTPDPYGRVRNLSRSVGGKTLVLGYDYDSVGRTTEITYAGGRTVSYDYDTSGRLETVPGYLSGRVAYDAAGRVSSLTAANGVRTTAERDLLGRLKELDYAGSVDVASFSLSYDSAGNIVRKNESTYTYDRANRLEAANERGRFANDRNAEQEDLGTKEDDTDGEGELTFTAEQTEVRFDYASMSIGVDLGATFEVSRITLDPRATGHRVTAERYEILVANYNAEGNWTRVQGAAAEVLPSGAILTRFKEPVEARYIKLHCYYDDLGADGKAVDKATVRNPLVTIGYFERNRDEDYEYDAKGNRKRTTTVFAGNTTSSSYTYYPNTDRIRTDGKYAYVYDPNGNMIEKGSRFEDTGSQLRFFDNEGEYFKYEYDLSNRLVRVLRSDAGTATAAERASYRYGPDGLRISKTTANGTTYYVYGLDGNELSEITDAGQTDTVWVLGKKFAEETTSGAATTRTYLATDHLGSVVAATDETGQVIWQGSLTAFGEDGGEAGLKDRVRSYAGKDWDEDAGLVYNNARWYDPRIGRFTTEDPARDGVNWYAYVNNRPLNATDPSGFEGEEPTDTSATQPATEPEKPEGKEGHETPEGKPEVQDKSEIDRQKKALAGC
jgi:RHS repeat-associated protein